MKSYKFWYVLVFTKFLSIHFGSYLYKFSQIMHPFVGKRHQNTWYMDGGLEHFLFFHTLGILIPTDEYVSQGSSERELPGCPAKWKQERTRTHDAPRCMMCLGTPCVFLGLFKVIVDQRIGEKGKTTSRKGPY